MGNQALLRASDNCALKSASCEEKAAVFQQSPYLTTSQIGELADWTIEAIQSRQKALAKLALRAWPIR
ncbi:MAG: DUF1524 domain-containing protein [Gammaproteobacteria bacterium]|nr:DUF1524 domain-containing protein [Gammaproteobacteria bacterium]